MTLKEMEIQTETRTPRQAEEKNKFQNTYFDYLRNQV